MIEIQVRNNYYGLWEIQWMPSISFVAMFSNTNGNWRHGLLLTEFRKNLSRVYILAQPSPSLSRGPRPPPSHPRSAFIPLPLWTCQSRSHALINHWGWACTLLGSAQSAQASSLTASAPGGWSPSCAPALARRSFAAWHGCPRFTSQPCQPCIPLLPLLVCVCVVHSFTSHC